jgi:HPt (histidine-containing phosphotransfer) domain-containing protein
MDRFEELKQRYTQAFPQKADQIDAAWKRLVIDPASAEARVALHQAVHRLIGSAAAYGFEELGDLAQVVDDELADWVAQSEFDRPPLTASLRTLSAGIAELLVALRSFHLGEMGSEDLSCAGGTRW